jgi:hypothetical protein
MATGTFSFMSVFMSGAYASQKEMALAAHHKGKTSVVESDICFTG